MSHVTHTNESCHAYEWVMSRIQMSHVTHTNESCHAYEWVMPRAYVWVISHLCTSHVAQLNEATWLVHMGDMTRSYARHESFICATWLVRLTSQLYTWDMTHSLWRKQLLRIFGPKLIQIDELIKTARNTENLQELFLFLAASAAKFWKCDISSASERAFPGFLCDFFELLNFLQKRCFSTNEFTRCLSTVLSQYRVTRIDVPFQTK